MATTKASNSLKINNIIKQQRGHRAGNGLMATTKASNLLDINHIINNNVDIGQEMD